LLLAFFVEKGINQRSWLNDRQGEGVKIKTKKGKRKKAKALDGFCDLSNFVA
jgi:hypothetical protein